MSKPHIYTMENVSGQELRPGEAVHVCRISPVTSEPEKGYSGKFLPGIVFSRSEKSREYYDVLVKGTLTDHYNFSIYARREE